LSFTKAAAELFVTPAAISQQVRALEEELGHPLFERRPRRLMLTDTGRRLLPSVTDSFARLATATANLDGAPMRGRLTVSVLPSFAHSWLVHRVGGFADRFPEIELVIM
jgi:LysR family glycine cleavage system transcriptional activator